MFRTPKRAKIIPEDGEILHVTPPNRNVKVKTQNSNEKAINGSPSVGMENAMLSPSETRRGRPRAELLNTLILEGSTSPSAIKCSYCNRVFPREKSLQAHLRTHTGEKPYVCDYPRCIRRFAQSGQLKTHQRLHTGEKPFVCSSPNCERRFTHANRHCPEHPEVQLKRFTSFPTVASDKSNDDEHSSAVASWLKNKKRYTTNGDIPSAPKKQSRITKSINSNDTSLEQNENDGCRILCKRKSSQDNIGTVNTTFSPFSVQNGVGSISPESSSSSYISFPELNIKSELSIKTEEPVQSLPPQELFKETVLSLPVQQIFDDSSNFYQMSCIVENVQDGPKVSSSTASADHVELPKKRWLREAVQDQQRWDSSQELARPINWGEDVNLIEYENQRRPTVLMRVQDNGEKKEISRADMQTAIALVELKNGGPIDYVPF